MMTESCFLEKTKGSWEGEVLLLRILSQVFLQLIYIPESLDNTDE